MLKLTRLNNHIVAINPDHIGWADATPDTTLTLINGEKIIVRESIDELISLVIDFRRLIQAGARTMEEPGAIVGDPPRGFTPSRRPFGESSPRLPPSPSGRKEER